MMQLNESPSDKTLFWVVTLSGILCSFIPLIVKIVLHIIARETEMEASLRRQVCDLKAELGSINMVDEFAKYAKIQRKISKLADELTHQAQMRSTYTLKVRLFVTVMLYAVMASAVSYLLWNYSSVAVITLPAEQLYPFGGLFAFASGLPEGGIGITPWLVVTGTVGRLMAKSLS